MLGERTWPQKDKYCNSTFMRYLRVVKFIEIESRLVVTRG